MWRFLAEKRSAAQPSRKSDGPELRRANGQAAGGRVVAHPGIERALASTGAGTCAAAAIGAGAWGSQSILLAAAPLVIALWASRPSRWAAWLVMLAYYLAAACGLPWGAARFFGSQAPALFSAALWIGASLALSVPWGLAWGTGGFWWRVPLACASCIVPPVGLVGWANPLSAAGILFPGMAWAGLVSMGAALIALCYWPARTAAALAALALLGSTTPLPTAPNWIEGHQTAYGGAGAAGRDFLHDYAANQDLIERALRTDKPYAVFPETVAGLWSPVTADLWQEAAGQLARQGRTVLVGAEVPIDSSARTRNALVRIGADGGEWVQRIPVPLAMWRPWSDSGTVADLGGDGIGLIQGQRVAVLICYEQLLVWPMLLSLAGRPQLMIGVANDYWAANTSIPPIQRTTLQAWSRLFGLPLVIAVNV